MSRAGVVVCALSALLGGCILERSGTGPDDGSTPGFDASAFDAAGFDAAGFDAAGFDAGSDAGFDAGSDAGVDSAVPIPDACAPSAETCDGFDQDCDGIVDNDLTRTCTTSCGTGTETCTLGSWFCDVRESTVEVCDDVDNDCDGMVDEMLTRACSSACGLGVETCSAGVFGPCSAPGPSAEVCDNADNDCNGMVDEGLTRTCSLATGACGTLVGTETCSAGSYGACEVAGLDPETCNGLDDDCDGTIDEGGVCPCTTRYHAGHAYLFCTGATDWVAARDACRSSGYELVTIHDAAESFFVVANALGAVDDDWWIGLYDRGMEGTWLWVSGSSSFDGWAPGEPNAFRAADDCGVVENGSNDFEDRGFWSDHNCGENNPYVCESP